MKDSYLYYLVDPQIWDMFYVGISFKELEDRLKSHIKDVRYKRKRKNHKVKRIKEILKAGYRPMIIPFAKKGPRAEMRKLEDWIIKALLPLITNAPPEVIRRKISRSQRGKKLTDQHKKNVSRGVKKMWENGRMGPERNKKVSEALKGKPKSEEHKQKLSAATKGRKRHPHESVNHKKTLFWKRVKRQLEAL